MSLRFHLAFDYQVSAADGYGGEVSGWSDVPQSYECRAEMIYWRGMENTDGAQQVGRERFKVRIRTSTAAKTITNLWRARDLRTGEVYNIKQVDNLTQVGWIYFVLEHGTLS